MNRKRGLTNKQKKRDAGKKRVILALVLIAVFCSAFGTLFATAQGNRNEEPVNFTYYKSVQIEYGDTLWDIAKTYMTDDYDSIPEYVEELKRMNSLHSDEIQEGRFLMVAYSDEEFR